MLHTTTDFGLPLLRDITVSERVSTPKTEHVTCVLPTMVTQLTKVPDETEALAKNCDLLHWDTTKQCA